MGFVVIPDSENIPSIQLLDQKLEPKTLIMPEGTIEQGLESTQVQPDELDSLLARLAVLKEYKD